MYLKRLELTGFKSFASRVRLEFDAGITAIVGPNGSGKSNISDSVRWILGEQSVKSLRGSKLEDIIFSGTDGKRPVGMAEVQLTLDNSDGFLPVDFQEVVVARRVYRSGESDFLINKRPCRLKDIQDLFTDTGLGREGYAIIGQNQFDTILSVNPKERRVIFEETAGIVRYKNRKEQAIKKIEQTEQDLLRVQDILAEVERHLEPLAQEAQKTRKYQGLARRLMESELDLYRIRLSELRRSQKDLDEQTHQASEVCSNLTEEYKQLESNVQALENELSELEHSLEHAQIALMDASERLGTVQRQIELDEERQRSAASAAERWSETQRVEMEKTEALDGKMDELDKAAALEDQAAADAKAELDIASDALRSLRVEQQQCRAALERRKNEFLDFMQELSDARNVRQNSREQTGRLEAQIKRLQSELTDKETERHENTSGLQTVQDSLEIARQEVSSHQDQYEMLLKEQQGLTGEHDKARREETRVQDELRQVESRLKALSELENNYEGFYHSVRRLLQAPIPNAKLHGTVADVMTVPRHLETAMEIALGPGLQNVIAATQKDAQEAIRWLKEKKAGRGTFLPLDSIQGREFPASYKTYWESSEGVLGPALDLVAFAPKYRKALASLLGRIAVTSDLRTASDLARVLPSFGRIVTIEGDVIMPSGAMTGGSTAGKTTGILSRKNQIKDLKAQVLDLENQLAVRQAECGRIASDLAANREQQALFEEKRSQADEERSRLERRFYELKLTADHIKREMEGRNAEILRLTTENEELKESADEAADRLGDMEVQERRLRAAIGDLEREVEHNERQLDEYQELVSQKRVQYTELANAVQRLQERRAELERQQLEAREQLEQSHIELEALGKQQVERKREQSRRASEAAVLEEERDRLREESETLRSRRGERQAELQVRSQRLRKLRSELSGAERKLHSLELDKGRVDDALERITDDLTQRDVPISTVVERSPTRSRDNLEDQVNQLNQEIRSLGAIHPGAIEEYEALQERQSFLHNQLQDLNEAKASLRAVIEEMDQTSRKRFRKTFSQLRQEFQRMFSELFMGGHADLVLVQPETPLESGIEIVAQPPGKKLQNLLLLSGGERALTAIALLFAILTVKPAPFCVLDEVDSALDEANLGRFAQVMKQFSTDIQFLVITHRRGTMEAADRLYGLTMTDSAVSQLVSVSLA